MNEIEMPKVKACSVKQCAYNMDSNCHAKAITVGDHKNPDCDTFFQSPAHTKHIARTAGVGACKVTHCQYNDDFECMANGIEVGVKANHIKCLTYAPRAA